MRKHLAIGVISGALVLSCAATAQAAPVRVRPAYRQPTPVTTWRAGAMHGSAWMIKANDYAEFPFDYGKWSWMLCGQSVGYGAESTPTSRETALPEYGRCAPGQIATFTNYASLVKAINRGRVRRGSTVVFDPEVWDWTPAWEQKNQAHWIKLGCRDASAHRVSVIVTPEGPAAQLTAQYDMAAKFCTIAEIQSQNDERSFRTFRARISSFLAIVHRYHHAQAMVGLATDPGGSRATPADLEQAYRFARKLGVRAYWMNADAWTGKPRMSGTGDASVAEAFFSWLSAR